MPAKANHTQTHEVHHEENSISRADYRVFLFLDWTDDRHIRIQNEVCPVLVTVGGASGVPKSRVLTTPPSPPFASNVAVWLFTCQPAENSLSPVDPCGMLAGVHPVKSYPSTAAGAGGK